MTSPRPRRGPRSPFSPGEAACPPDAASPDLHPLRRPGATREGPSCRALAVHRPYGSVLPEPDRARVPSCRPGPRRRVRRTAPGRRDGDGGRGGLLGGQAFHAARRLEWLLLDEQDRDQCRGRRTGWRRGRGRRWRRRRRSRRSACIGSGSVVMSGTALPWPPPVAGDALLPRGPWPSRWRPGWRGPRRARWCRWCRPCCGRTSARRSRRPVRRAGTSFCAASTRFCISMPTPMPRNAM